MNKDLLRIWGRAIFFLGVLIGFALAIVMIWNKVEAVRYYFNGAKYEQFSGLRCPLMIAPTEKGVVTAAFDNPTDQEIAFFYRAEISGAASTRRVEDHIAVPAHRTKTIPLIVDGNDVDLLYFIFVKMNVLPNSLYGSQQSVCGIRMINILGFTGKQIPVLALSLSFLGMAVGLGLGRQTGNKREQTTERVMQALGAIVLLTLLAGALGWWLPGMALSAIAILLMLISVRVVIG